MKDLHTYIICIFLVCSSCSEERITSRMDRNIEIEFSGLNFSEEENPTRSTSNEEEKLSKVYLAFFDVTTQHIIGNPYTITESNIANGRTVINDYDETLLNRRVTVVIIANPDNILLEQLNSCSTYTDLQLLKTSLYGNYFTLPPVMHGEKEHSFTTDDMTVQVALQRLPAKIEINCDMSQVPSGYAVSSLIWEDIPIQSFCTYTTSGELPRGKVKSGVTSSDLGLITGVGYPYEYSKGSTRGKVKIEVSRSDGSKGFYYCLLPEELQRNHWYKIRLTLVGEGGNEEQPTEIEAEISVIPWKNEENDFTIGNTYLECENNYSLYVRTLGTVVNPDRSFRFHTNVPIDKCKVVPEDPDLLQCEIIPVKDGGIINFSTKKDVFYEFHPRVETSIIIEAENIRRSVNITLIPLIEIHPDYPNIIMVWPGHEFYNQSVRYGGLYIQTPFDSNGYACNQHAEPNMCQKFEVYDMDKYGSLYGLPDAFQNYIIENKEYYEDFFNFWPTLNNCDRGSDGNVVRNGRNNAENLGNEWRYPTEYELRAIYQAWAHFGRPTSEGGSETPPSMYKTEQEKELYYKARAFYRRFYCDEYHLYGCTTYKNEYGGITVAQHFRYNWDGYSWIPNQFSVEYSYRKGVIIRPVRDYMKWK